QEYGEAIVFFFSSRRRHTRSKRDWSSDVCSSDLDVQYVQLVMNPSVRGKDKRLRSAAVLQAVLQIVFPVGCTPAAQKRGSQSIEIGRASCREREERSAVAVTRKRTRRAAMATTT